MITSGCVVNNIFDRDIDQKMTHKKREWAKGNINIASVYVLVMGISGVLGVEVLPAII